MVCVGFGEILRALVLGIMWVDLVVKTGGALINPQDG